MDEHVGWVGGPVGRRTANIDGLYQAVESAFDALAGLAEETKRTATLASELTELLRDMRLVLVPRAA